MTGRFTQLGRQLRKLRHIVGGAPATSPVTTLRRATQLACDLACEHAAVDDAQAALHDLAGRGILDPALAERLAAWVAANATGVTTESSQREDAGQRAIPIGRDLDTFLRSLEIGAPAPELPFEPIVTREGGEGAKPDSAAGVPISGRVLELEVRGGLAVIAVDAQPIPLTVGTGDLAPSFALASAPMSTPDVEREPTGVTRVVWALERLVIELTPDFRRARVELRSA